MNIENYENSNGEPMVKIINEDGSCICFTEAQYAEHLAAQEQQSGTL